MNYIKISIKKILFILNQFGINPIMLFNSIRGLPFFLYDIYKFTKGYRGPLSLMPCLHDRFDAAGAVKSEYFWQDLLVAQYIYKNNPAKHVDVGSRLDGFIAHIASFRDIEVLDIRPLNATIPGIKFQQLNVMNSISIDEFGKGYCDSISCLHTIEHFGLGRYGDEIIQDGYKIGLSNMSKLLKLGGIFYLSTPIGRQRVEFNANWVFDPNLIISAAKSHGLILKEFKTIFKGEYINHNFLDINLNNIIPNKNYCLGLYIFHKNE